MLGSRCEVLGERTTGVGGEDGLVLEEVLHPGEDVVDVDWRGEFDLFSVGVYPCVVEAEGDIAHMIYRRSVGKKRAPRYRMGELTFCLLPSSDTTRQCRTPTARHRTYSDYCRTQRLRHQFGQCQLTLHHNL